MKKKKVVMGLDLKEMGLLFGELVILTRRMGNKKDGNLVTLGLIRSKLVHGLSLVQRCFDNMNDAENEAAMERVLSSERAVISAVNTDTFKTKAENGELVVNLMKKLREKGATFEEISDFLNEKHIPTFSGKGGWHAQTIHRLCPKKNNKKKEKK